MLTAILAAGLLQGSIYALTSIGLTLMFGVLRVVNFAHGDFLMVALYASYLLFVGPGLDPLLSVVVTVPGFVLGGALLYRLLIRRTFTAPAPLLAQVFATVGLSIFLQNLALLTMGADYYGTTSEIVPRVVVLSDDLRLEGAKLVVAIAVVAVAGGLSWLLYRTALGRRMRAVAQSPTAATLMGIDVQRVYTWTFAIACGVIGLSGTLLSSSFLVSPTVGLHFALLCFMTVVIGGLGSLRGAVLGGLLIGVVEAGTGFLLGAIFSQVFIYVIFLAVLLLRPAGLFGLQGYLEAKSE